MKNSTINISPSQDQKNIATLCYVFFAFGYISKEKNNSFVKFHMEQSLVLLLSAVFLTFVNIIPILGPIIYFFGAIAIVILFL
jgi:uncharacterized membrane protein